MSEDGTKLIRGARRFYTDCLQAIVRQNTSINVDILKTMERVTELLLLLPAFDVSKHFNITFTILQSSLGKLVLDDLQNYSFVVVLFKLFKKLLKF